jgi:replicative DNA helicase
VSVESAVVSHIVLNGEESLLAVINSGVTSAYFTEERTHAAFVWLTTQWGTHGRLPGQETFERRFRNFKYVYGDDKIEALVDELRDHYAQSKAVELLPPIVTEWAKHRDGPDRFSLPKVLGMMAELFEVTNLIRSANETALLTEKTSSYLEQLFSMDGTEVPGIPTGFDTLDIASGGWQPENFGVIGAGPKRFKTAILVWMALAAARAGYRCKVVTFEMSIKELMDRTFCLGGQVNYTNILRGNLNDKEKVRLSRFEAEMGGWTGDIEIVHDVSAVTSVGGLASQIRTNRPDIVFIDGIYQMIDDTREWTSEAMALTAVSRGLKRLAATEGLPIVGTTQALLSRLRGRKGMDMGSIGYTSAFAQDANILLGIDRPDMQANDIILKVIGARTMAGTAVNVTVDLTTGTLYEAGEVSVSGSDGDSGYD